MLVRHHHDLRVSRCSCSLPFSQTSGPWYLPSGKFSSRSPVSMEVLTWSRLSLVPSLRGWSKKDESPLDDHRDRSTGGCLFSYQFQGLSEKTPSPILAFPVLYLNLHLSLCCKQGISTRTNILKNKYRYEYNQQNTWRKMYDTCCTRFTIKTGDISIVPR